MRLSGDYQPIDLVEHGLEAIGLHPLTEPEGDLLPFYVKLNLASQLAAALLSYSRNGDVRWALVHGLMGPFYLAFVGAKALSLEEARVLDTLFER